MVSAFSGGPEAKKGEIIWHKLKPLNGTDVTAGSDDNEEISQQDFKASNGWVVRFMNRRKHTSLAQHDPGKLINHMISFNLHVRKISHKAACNGKYNRHG